MTILERKLILLSIGFVLSGTTSCSVQTTGVSQTPQPPTTLIESTTFHFGPVINKPGRWLSHKYLLINRLGHDIELTDVVNQKPCCGVVEFQKRRLRPDDQAEIEIKLAVGGRIGDISHQAEVITNPALPESLRHPNLFDSGLRRTQLRKSGSRNWMQMTIYCSLGKTCLA